MQGRGAVKLLAMMLLISSAGAGLSVFGLGIASATGGPCTIAVHGENLADNAVQSAINAAHPGATVCLGPGTYPEQITIATPNLHLVGAGAHVTILDPTSGVVNAVDWDSGTSPEYPLIAVVLVENVSGVTIRGVTVDAAGAAASITGCTPGIVGVDFQNVSSGLLTNAIVTGAELSPALLGCQSQSGVYAYTGYFTTHYTPAGAAVTVSATAVAAYGKGGIVCDDPGLTCTLTHDQVTGIGPTPAIAANGIQIAYGAVGHLAFDTVSQNAYTGPYAALDWYATAPGQTVGYESTGILLYQAGAGSRVLDCHLVSNAIGIAGFQDVSDRLAGNIVTNSQAYGIVENGRPTSTATISGNLIGNPVFGAIGILVDNGTFTVVGDVISSALDAGSQGASQPVSGPNTYYPTAPDANITTAGIQAVSEGGPTHLILAGVNTVVHSSDRLATLSIFSGSVRVTVI